ncbi:META domain-containing protein [Pontibacter burrus]|uniref:META domain-containing protein n=1 Tax=Pontibacter burrus TaxID=2704466 RepID=A0A6B3LWB5_9BACT|nr:META domain-containing protein [Pontibacter burrus]NEM98596.1 META domain-containing protein [Pontibacter burrus]
MKQSHTLLFLQLLGMLLCVVLALFCFRSGTDEAHSEGVLTGKWRLIHLEDSMKVVVPPTSVVQIELQFADGNFTFQQNDADKVLTGNILSGDFTGTVEMNSKLKQGNLDVEELHVTENILLERYKNFDDYYLQQLARASSYCIEKDKLIITSRDKANLVYAWVGE